MPLKRELWNGRYSFDSFLSFPCPKCKQGRINILYDALSIKETAYSIALRESEEWYSDMATKRFSVMIECNNRICGEWVTATGYIGHNYDWDSTDDGSSVTECIDIRSMYPAPPIIDIPQNTPPIVDVLINLAFQLYWMDLSSCVNRLRTSVELILDDLNVPRENHKNKQLPLKNRIDLFKEIDPEHADSMDALRLVGNIGSHTCFTHRDAVLDMFHVLEEALAELYAKRSETTRAIKEKIFSTKGRYE